MGLVPRSDPARKDRRVAAALFVATCCTVFLVYGLGWQHGVPLGRAMGRSSVFTVAMMAILLVHEVGHVVVARRHRFRIGWPYFLPFPLWIGTLGAVIRLAETPRTRIGLLEMGAAGPLAGVVAVMVTVVLWVLAGPIDAAPGEWTLATPALFHVVHLALRGAGAPAISTSDPLGFAAWVGCLVTAMNLVPFGQLDGGHLVRATAPRHARAIGWVATGVLLVAGLWWPGWAVWAALLHLAGARHPVSVRDLRPPPRGRTIWVLALCVAAFVVTATAAPIVP